MRDHQIDRGPELYVGTLDPCAEDPFRIDPAARIMLFTTALRYASAFTASSRQARRVIDHAEVVFAFMTDATTMDDLHLRRQACSHQDLNSGRDKAFRPDDDPHAFVRQAEELYASMRAAELTDADDSQTHPRWPSTAS